MNGKVLKILAAVKPPKNEGFEESTIQDAIEACPVLKSYQGYGKLDPWQTGVFTALGKLHDTFVDAGLDDALTDITEDDIASTDDFLSHDDHTVMKAMPELVKFVENGSDPFKAGVVCAFTAVFLHAQTETPTEADEPPMPDLDTEVEVSAEPAPTMPIVPQTRIKADFNELIEALHIAGMNVNEISLSVTRRDGRNVVAMTGQFGPSVAFTAVAKINAVFKTLTGKDLVLVIQVGGERGTNGIGFNFEI